MRDQAFGPVQLPEGFWIRTDVRQALTRRDIGALIRLLSKHGVGQTRTATATGLSQARVSELARDRRNVTALETFTRIADGLAMPDHARISLGLAPHQPAPVRMRSPAMTTRKPSCCARSPALATSTPPW